MKNHNLNLFPARAGMNRLAAGLAIYGCTVPRTRGDEPDDVADSHSMAHCSPHARG